MTTQLSPSNVPAHLLNPQLSDYDNLSRVTWTDAVVGYEADDDGYEWPMWATFCVGDKVIDTRGNAWTILAFTRDNLFVLSHYGLSPRADGIVRMLRRADGLEPLEKPICSSGLRGVHIYG